jgi:hypothetical protein
MVPVRGLHQLLHSIHNHNLTPRSVGRVASPFKCLSAKPSSLTQFVVHGLSKETLFLSQH